MQRNFELKARLADRTRAYERALPLATAPAETIHQKDTYFAVPHGRLKLRVMNGEQVELIFYLRPDEATPKLSHYRRVPLDDEYPMAAILSAQFGVRNVVVKERTVLIAGDARIHFDRVQGLGDFIELEVVLEEGTPDEYGKRRAGDLIEHLGIPPSSFVAPSYTDLLAARGQSDGHSGVSDRAGGR
jgi:predicted adenylyl cyclase CyaB